MIRTEPKRLNIEVTFDINNVQILKITRMLPKLVELLVHCSWTDDIPDAVISFLINSNAIMKFALVLNFDTDDEGPSPKYLQMRQVFREKIARNGVVALTWKYKFEYKEDCVYHIDSVQFQKIE